MGMHRGRTSAAPAGGAAAERSAASAQAPEWAWADGQSARAGARAADLTRGALKAVAHGTHVLVPHRAGPATHKATEEVAVGAMAGHGRGADHAQGVGAGGQRREAGASQPVVQEGGHGGVRDLEAGPRVHEHWGLVREPGVGIVPQHVPDGTAADRAPGVRPTGQ